MNQPNIAPSIVVDYRKNRIRIHKAALHELGNPQFVQLLVNPAERSLAVQNCQASDPTAHRIPASIYTGKVCCEIYSRSLMQQLLFCSDWSNDSVYRMYASAFIDKQLLVFRIDDSIVIDSSGFDVVTEGV